MARFLVAIAAVGALHVGSPVVPALAQDLSDGFERGLHENLERAGIAYDKASLVSAIQHPDVTVAVIAAHFLSRFTADELVEQALLTAMRSPAESLAVAAARSLQHLRISGWEDEAIRRLPEMEDPSAQVLLAEVLARAGRSEGWPVVRQRLLDGGSFTGNAAYAVVEFDGLRDSEGRVIDAVVELQRLRERASRSKEVAQFTRAMIERLIEQTRTRRRHTEEVGPSGQ